MCVCVCVCVCVCIGECSSVTRMTPAVGVDSDDLAVVLFG